MKCIKTTILLLAILSLSACVNLEVKPRYVTYSFAPNTILGKQSVFCANNYYYYDGNTSNIYKLTDAEPELIIEDVIVDAISGNKDHLYFLDSPKLYELDLTTGFVGETPSDYYFYDVTVYEDDVFIYGGKHNDYSLYKVTAGNMNQLFESAVSAQGIEVDDDLGTYEIYTALTDGKYRYIFEGNYANEKISGVYEKESEKVVFHRNYFNQNYEESLIYVKNDFILFVNNDGELTIKKDGYSKSLALFPDGYRFHLNNIICDGENVYALLQKSLWYDRLIRESSDILLSVDMDNGAQSILYKSKNANERIIGYANGFIYIFELGVIYCLDPKTDEREIFIELPVRYENVPIKYKSYAFEMCGEKLFVWGDSDSAWASDFIGAYDIK
jgi:hypothetical protein